MPSPLQPFLHDLVCVLAAPTQVWSAADGEMHLEPGAGGLAGVLHADVRVLSGLQVTLDGERVEHLATRASATSAVFTGLLRDGGDGPTTARPPVRLDRRREVAPGRLAEELVLVCSADQAVRVGLEVTLVADASPVQRVNDGYPPVGTEVGQPVPTTLTWDAAGVEVRVEASGATVTRSADPATATLRWAVEVPAGGEAVLDWSLTASDPGGVVVPAPAAAAAYPTAPGTDHRLVSWLERSAADLAGLRMATAEAPDDVFYAAGAPWYLTLFGRDSLWAARMVLPVDLEPARGTLRTLARLQGRVVDPRTAEQPGKIPHELRRGEYRLAGMVLPPLYYGTVDATPLWVCLLHDAWRAGLPDAEVRALLPALEGALGWLTQYADADGDGFCEYRDESGSGLANQGWKDSVDALRFADGSHAEGPIALCEVQGYAYEAARSGADLLDAFGRPGAEALRRWAAALRDRFRAAFWCGEGEDRYPALALDGAKRRVDALTSNIGHLLGTGLLDPDEEQAVARHLRGPDLDSGLGLRTMAKSAGGYAPLSYHCGSVWPHDTAIVVDRLYRAGLGDAASGLVEGLLRASVAFDGRLPELWSGEGFAVPYPAACRPQAWSAAAAVVVASRLGVLAD